MKTLEDRVDAAVKRVEREAKLLKMKHESSLAKEKKQRETSNQNSDGSGQKQKIRPTKAFKSTLPFLKSGEKIAAIGPGFSSQLMR